MEAIIIPLVSVGISAVVAFLTTLITLRSSRKQSLEQDYDKALEELQKIYLDLEVHIEEEIRGWWINMDYGDKDGPKPKKYIYPIDKMRMLAERYEPTLNKDVEQIANVIAKLRGNYDPEDWMHPAAYYEQVIRDIDFSKTKRNLATKFKEINQKYNQKRSSKPFLVAPL